MRRFWIFLFPLFGLLAGLFFAEVIARGVVTDFYRCDSTYGWSYIPSQGGFRFSRALEYFVPVRINSLGFRDRERSYSNEEGKRRILLLGDSFTSALQVPFEETFGHVLEDTLDSAIPTDKKYEVINVGVDGYGTAQELLTFVGIGRRFSPKLVVLAFYFNNDLWDNSSVLGGRYHDLAARCGRKYPDGIDSRQGVREPLPSGKFESMLRYSRIYSIFHPRMLIPARDTLHIELDDAYDIEFPRALEEAWRSTQSLLVRLAREVRDEGADFVVLIIPDRYQVKPDWAVEDVKHLGDRDLERPVTVLSKFLDENHIAYFNPLSDLRSCVTEKCGDPYFRKDAHFTRVGHQIVGKAFAKWLLERESLP